MFRRFDNRFWAFVLVVVFGWTASVSVAQEFRIDTDIYVGKQTKPVAHTVTLFDGEMIYDFKLSEDPNVDVTEVVIFNGRTREFILLDPSRKIQLTIQQSQLLEIVEGSRLYAAQKKESSFFVNDKFTESFDIGKNEITVQSPHFKYVVKGSQPKNVQVMPKYGEFLNQFTRLKATDPHGDPPFVRLKVNESIKKFGWLPTEIQVTKNLPNMKRPIVLASRHTLINQLSDQDKVRIDKAKKSWLTFKAATLATCLLYTSPSPRDLSTSRMPSSA